MTFALGLCVGAALAVATMAIVSKLLAAGYLGKRWGWRVLGEGQ